MWQSIMLHVVKLIVGVSRACEDTKQLEGMLPIGCTSMKLKDQLRQVPKPVIVLAKIDGHQVSIASSTIRVQARYSLGGQLY